MILGQVIGTLWSTRKHAALERRKLVLVRPYAYYLPAHDTELVVAVDELDAGPGDDVLLCLGSPARWALGGRNLPVDATVMGIVDRCQLERAAFTPEARRPLAVLGGRTPRRTEWL